ncbi:hypothetical protein C8D92_103340 [Tamilnaduibacter salinus]|uniref:Uncharacterized protein n=1 Tax=Tamilnaduibacter salinus TaxID=1484056 RepID=A0A2U1CYU7_9GAMM|nr:hypothetical protein [Tamilnaduibacter salinus]PVY77653.1 hypothetical protein C8D92_103340 [Tamilnaduibacter salinus]
MRVSTAIQSRVARYALVALVGAVSTAPVWAQSPSSSQSVQGAFTYEERSTLKTIPFESMDQQAMSSTVIEGGLDEPAAGVPTRSPSGGREDHYLDPLALQPNDGLSSAERGQIPVEIIYSEPKRVPGQTFSDDYVIRPPQNRTYEALNTNLTDRP